MSLTLTALGAYFALKKSKGNSMDNYVLGIDAVGAEDADVKTDGTEVHVHTGTYWTSVAAGLTVAALWTLFTGAAAVGGKR